MVSSTRVAQSGQAGKVTLRESLTDLPSEMPNADIITPQPKPDRWQGRNRLWRLRSMKGSKQPAKAGTGLEAARLWRSGK